MNEAVGEAAEVARNDADGGADSNAEADGDDSDHERDACAEHRATEDVAAQAVGAEGVGGGGSLQEGVPVDSLRVVGEDRELDGPDVDIGEDAGEEEEANDDESEDAQGVAQAKGEGAAPERSPRRGLFFQCEGNRCLLSHTNS